MLTAASVVFLASPCNPLKLACAPILCEVLSLISLLTLPTHPQYSKCFSSLLSEELELAILICLLLTFFSYGFRILCCFPFLSSLFSSFLLALKAYPYFLIFPTLFPVRTPLYSDSC